MLYPLCKEDHRKVLRIVCIYALFGALWIYFSDTAVVWLVSDPDVITRIGTYKGLLFIVLTASLLYGLIARHVFQEAKSKQQIAASEERKHLFFERQLVGMGISSPAKEWIEVNDKLCEMLGYSREELKHLTWEKMTHPEDIKQSNIMYNKLLSGEIDEYSFERRYIRKDGTVLYGNLSSGCIRRPDGTVDYVLELLEDITERKIIDGELKRYRENLEEAVETRTAELLIARDAAENANRAKSTFLANMSHEIRTPMNAVLGFAQLLERDPSLSPHARDRVATIMKSGGHLLEVINDILEMSRIEAGRIELRSEPLDLYSLLDDLTAMFRMRAEEKGLAFVLNRSPELPRHIMTDIGKLRQVLINLLGNAIKFTIQGSIIMRPLQAGIGRIAIEIQDSGIGMTPDELEKLFRPFERLKSGEQVAGGTGLGLAISREYAHVMGGEITVESSAGSGSCFRFEFPAPECAAAAVSTVAPCRTIALTPGQGEIHILVVDDLQANRELLRDMLESIGFIVDEAADGREAIEQVNRRKPRIVLMDLVMPDIDGIEATRILRRTFTQESLTIIGVSASAFETQRFLDAGIDAFIAKPFRTQELYDLLASHAGVLFVTGDDKVVSDIGMSQDIPTLENMSTEWRAAFREALARKNITHIRKLGEEARESDPLLSAWLLERVTRYDLKGLEMLGDDNKQGVCHE